MRPYPPAPKGPAGLLTLLGLSVPARRMFPGWHEALIDRACYSEPKDHMGAEAGWSGCWCKKATCPQQMPQWMSQVQLDACGVFLLAQTASRHLQKELVQRPSVIRNLRLDQQQTCGLTGNITIVLVQLTECRSITGTRTSCHQLVTSTL